jgi:hypothetical protein
MNEMSTRPLHRIRRLAGEQAMPTPQSTPMAQQDRLAFSPVLRVGLRRGPLARFAFFESGSYRSAARFRLIAAEFRSDFF